MSKLLIQQYLNELQKQKLVSGTTRESVVREAFKDLLKAWARSHLLTFVPEHEIAGRRRSRSRRTRSSTTSTRSFTTRSIARSTR
jgi:hypothetical protein